MLMLTDITKISVSLKCSDDFGVSSFQVFKALKHASFQLGQWFMLCPIQLQLEHLFVRWVKSLRNEE